MKRMTLQDVVGFYYESVFGGSKAVRPRGYETRGGQDVNGTNRTLARLFFESLDDYEVVKERLHQWFNGSEALCPKVEVFLATAKRKLKETPVYFALDDDSRPTTTVDAVKVPTNVLMREKRAWRRKNPGLPAFNFAPSFRSWRDKDGRWLCYEIDLPPAN
jgi:hypothetical protein